VAGRVRDAIWQCVLPHLASQQRVLAELDRILKAELDVTSSELLLLDVHSHTLRTSDGEGDRAVTAWGDGACGQAAQHGEIVRAHTADGDSELVIPLYDDGSVIGVLDLCRKAPQAFSESDEALFAEIADQVQVALIHTLRYNELREEVRDTQSQLEEQTKRLRDERDRADFLYRVTQEMTSTLDLERVLNRTLARVSQALGVRQGSILLLDPETGYLVYRVALGRPTALPRGGKPTRYRRGVGLAGWVLEHDECAIITGLDEDPRWEIDPEQKGSSESVLAVPLSASGDVLGVMLLFHPEPNYFHRGHTVFATAAANHITVAIKNTELYRLVRDQAARLGDMLRRQRGVAAQHMAILSAITDGVAVSDDTGTITVVNRAARRVMHLGEQELIGQPPAVLFDSFPEEDRQKALQAIGQVAADSERGRRASPVSLMIRRQSQIVEASFMPMLDERQEFSGTVLVLRDITHEQEIAQAKTEFVSTVAHELRTPMTSIKGYTDLLLGNMVGNLNREQRHFLGIIRSNIERLADLVSDLLDTSRIDAGRIRLEPEEIQITEVVRDACDSVAETIRESGLKLTTQEIGPMPKIYGDRNRLIQVMVNLLSNAYRYTPAGGEISVSVESTENVVTVRVSDTGIGIAPEDQERIFERFYRADHELVQKQAGTGLGLSIVKSLIEMHGGELGLESTPGQGSTFSFALPARPN
jgi:PAS domain S-box-containing protein